jgi:hypothetical protein
MDDIILWVNMRLKETNWLVAIWEDEMKTTNDCFTYKLLLPTDSTSYEIRYEKSDIQRSSILGGLSK